MPDSCSASMARSVWRASGCCGTSRRGGGAGIDLVEPPPGRDVDIVGASRPIRVHVVEIFRDRPMRRSRAAPSASVLMRVDEARNHDRVRGVDHLVVIGDYDGATATMRSSSISTSPVGRSGIPRSM